MKTITINELVRINRKGNKNLQESIQKQINIILYFFCNRLDRWSMFDQLFSKKKRPTRFESAHMCGYMFVFKITFKI